MNIEHHQQVLKDLYLVAIVTFITAICAFLLFLGVVIPPLRPKPSLVDDREKGDGVNVSNKDRHIFQNFCNRSKSTAYCHGQTTSTCQNNYVHINF